MTAKNNSSVAPNPIKTSGLHPTPEKFQAAVQTLEREDRKVTRRAVHGITGGTMSVVNQMCREYEEHKASVLSAYALPAEVVMYLKKWGMSERENANKDMAKQLADAKATVLDLESQVEELENRVSHTEAFRAEEVLLRMKAEAEVEAEKQAHEETKRQLEIYRHEADKAKQESSKKEGQMLGLIKALEARDHDNHLLLEKLDRLFGSPSPGRIIQTTSSNSSHAHARLEEPASYDDDIPF